MDIAEALEQYCDLLRIVGLPFNEKPLKILQFALTYNGDWFRAREMIDTINLARVPVYKTLKHLENLGVIETIKPKIPKDLGENARKSYKKEKWGNTRVRKLYRINIDGFQNLIDEMIHQLETLKKYL